MDKAAEKWREFDEKAERMVVSATGGHSGYGAAQDRKASREAYKASLRKAIEKRQRESDYLHEWNTQEILDLIEEVEP